MSPVPHKLIIFDADGTLRRTKGDQSHPPFAMDEWYFEPDALTQIMAIDWSEKKAGVASNQASVERGLVDWDDAWFMLEVMLRYGTGRNWPFAVIQMCPHLPDSCECRKPHPAMLESIMEFWRIPAHETLFIGDAESDKEAAVRAGCDFLWAEDFRNGLFSRIIRINR